MPEQVFIENFHFNQVSVLNPETANRGIEYRRYLGTASIEYPNLTHRYLLYISISTFAAIKTFIFPICAGPLNAKLIHGFL